MNESSYCFSLLHIDVARNATDDFNPFHDKTKWNLIKGNPYQGPIVLGFQLVSLISHEVKGFRLNESKSLSVDREGLLYSYYSLNFAGAVRPSDVLTINIKPSQLKVHESQVTISNRFIVKNNQKLSIVGYKRESNEILILPDVKFDDLPELSNMNDRSFVADKRLFYKRKFLNTANGKNFLVGSLIEQTEYFDEINERVEFPESFIVSLISCALLERAEFVGHDFLSNPMVYVSFELCLNKVHVKSLKSNDMLGLLVEELSTGDEFEMFHCYGLIDNNDIVFRAILKLAPLSIVLKAPLS